MLKSFIIQLRRQTLSSIFIIIAFTVSILVYSFGVSKITEDKHRINDVVEASKNKLIVSIASEKGIDINSIEEKFSSFSQDNYLSMNVPIQIGEEKTNWVAQCVLVKRDETFYPMIQGRYFNTKDMSTTENVTVLGYTFSRRMIKKGSNYFLTLNGKDYKVIGVIGNKDRDSGYDTLIQLPINKLRVIMNNNKLNFLEISVKNTKHVPNEEARSIEEYIKKLDNTANISIGDDPSPSANSNRLKQDLQYTSKEVGTILLISLINIVIVSIYIVKNRSKDLVVLKICGAHDNNIFMMVFIDFMIMAFMGTFLALVIQYIMSKFFMNQLIYLDYSRYFSVTNYISAVFLSLILSLISSAISLKNVLNMPLAEAIKR